jgi:hypothetical protein
VLAVALAIVSWQASRAVKEASRAQAMQDFVIALFENSGNASSTRGVDVRALLEAGVARADTELAAQPQARAELLGLIARLRSGLGDDAEALALLDRQQQLLEPLGSAAPPRPAARRRRAARIQPAHARPRARMPQCAGADAADRAGRRRRRAAAGGGIPSRSSGAATPCSRAGRWRATCSGQALQLRRGRTTPARWSPRARPTWPSWHPPRSA